jgi:hypothetical protein
MPVLWGGLKKEAGFSMLYLLLCASLSRRSQAIDSYKAKVEQSEFDKKLSE